MVAHNPHAPPRISRDDAIALFRRADQALHAAASRSVEEKFRIAKVSGIHFDELERLIGNDPDERASDEPSETPSRRRSGPSVSAEAPLPDGSKMPEAPATIAKHPSVQSAFRRGVRDSFSRAASCPYGENGIAKACGRAWAEGLRIGRAARWVAP